MKVTKFLKFEETIQQYVPIVLPYQYYCHYVTYGYLKSCMMLTCGTCDLCSRGTPPSRRWLTKVQYNGGTDTPYLNFGIKTYRHFQELNRKTNLPTNKDESLSQLVDRWMKENMSVKVGSDLGIAGIDMYDWLITL